MASKKDGNLAQDQGSWRVGITDHQQSDGAVGWADRGGGDQPVATSGGDECGDHAARDAADEKKIADASNCYSFSTQADLPLLMSTDYSCDNREYIPAFNYPNFPSLENPMLFVHPSQFATSDGIANMMTNLTLDDPVGGQGVNGTACGLPVGISMENASSTLNYQCDSGEHSLITPKSCKGPELSYGPIISGFSYGYNLANNTVSNEQCSLYYGAAATSCCDQHNVAAISNVGLGFDELTSVPKSNLFNECINNLDDQKSHSINQKNFSNGDQNYAIPLCTDVNSDPHQHVSNIGHMSVTDSEQGYSGKPMESRSNAFEIDVDRNCIAFHVYTVDVLPKHLAESYNEILQALEPHTGTLGPFYISGSHLFLTRFIGKEPIILESYIKDCHSFVAIKICHVKPLQSDDIMIKELNSFFHDKYSNNLVMHQNGCHKSRFNNPLNSDSHHLQLGHENSPAINKAHECDQLLPTNLMQKIIPTQNVLSLICNIKSKSSPDSFMHNCEVQLVGQSVQATYDKMVYTVTQIAWHQTPGNTTVAWEGGSMTLSQYYEQMYGLSNKLEFDQPLLQAIPQGMKQCELTVSILVPQLCYLSVQTDTVKQELDQVARDPPMDPKIWRANMDDLVSYQSDQVKSQLLAQRDIHIKNNSLPPNERVLEPPQALIFGRGSIASLTNSEDFSDLTQCNYLAVPITIVYWAILAPKKLQGEVEAFLEILIEAAHNLGLILPKPYCLKYLSNGKAETYTSTVEFLQARCKKDHEVGLQLVLTILTQQDQICYGALKTLCHSKLGIVNQTLVGTSIISKKNNPYNLEETATRLASQINSKLGGEAWNIDFPVKNHIMFVGVEVSQDSTDPSVTVVAVVATTNANCSQYYSVAHWEASNHSTLATWIGHDVAKAATIYARCNGGQWPVYVVVYRNGVIDKLESVDMMAKEAISIKNALRMTSPKPCKMAFLVINENCSAPRLIWDVQAIPLGTVLDQTSPATGMREFFLASSRGPKEKTAPVQYSFLCNEPGIDVEKLQALTFLLTFMYFNKSRAIAIPAPCMYAQNLSKMVGKTMHSLPHESLCDKLFYL